MARANANPSTEWTESSQVAPQFDLIQGYDKLEKQNVDPLELVMLMQLETKFVSVFQTTNPLETENFW